MTRLPKPALVGRPATGRPVAPCRSATGARWHRAAGAAAVEFALTLSLLMVVAMGLIDYGYFFYVHHHVTNAAREGARDVVRTPDCGYCPRAEAYLISALGSLPVGWTCPPAGGNTVPVTLAGVSGCEVVLAYPVGRSGSLTGFLSGTSYGPPAYARARIVMRSQR